MVTDGCVTKTKEMETILRYSGDLTSTLGSKPYMAEEATSLMNTDTYPSTVELPSRVHRVQLTSLRIDYQQSQNTNLSEQKPGMPTALANEAAARMTVLADASSQIHALIHRVPCAWRSTSTPRTSLTSSCCASCAG